VIPTATIFVTGINTRKTFSIFFHVCIFSISCRGYQNNISQGKKKKKKKMCCQSRRPSINPGIATWLRNSERTTCEVSDPVGKKGDSYGKFSSLQNVTFNFLGG
jgi:hypothetical protein